MKTTVSRFDRHTVSSSAVKMVLIFTYLLIGAVVAPPCFSRDLPDATSKVLIFSDQLNDNPGSANFIFAASHYIGMQKIDKVKIDAYRELNPDFIPVQYHKAYGVDLGGNITNAHSPFWNNDCDSLYAWQERNPQYGPLEDYYLHYGNISDSDHRIGHYWNNNREYWLADIGHEGYRRYVAEETSRRCSEIGFEGTFYDCAYFPSYGYDPEDWCTTAPWNIESIVQFATTWNETYAVPFWQYVYRYYHSDARDYLCLPNCDQMVTGWYDDDYLNHVDGAMIEGFFTYGGQLTGNDWSLSAERIIRYLTGKGCDKIMIAQASPDANDMRLRRWLIANYFLLKNRYSYYNYAHSMTANWWPEYTIEIGSFVSVPAGLGDLLVSGAESLYLREYASGLVLVNPGDGDQTVDLTEEYDQVSFSGGGDVANGNLPEMSLEYAEPVSGRITIGPGEAVILRVHTFNKIKPMRPALRNLNQKPHTKRVEHSSLKGQTIKTPKNSAAQALIIRSGSSAVPAVRFMRVH